MPLVIDLFAGAGGLSLGATRAGFDLAAAIELEPHAMSTHCTNFPSSLHITHDIMELTGSQILEQTKLSSGQIIGVIGGPPCQGFSAIGQQQVDDPRNRLFVKFFQLVEELQPAFFVAENVPGIMDQKYVPIRNEAFSHLKNYSVLEPIVVNACEYGAPTIRTRIFFIGYKPGEEIAPLSIQDIEAMKVPEDSRTRVGLALEGLPECVDYSLNHSGYCTLDSDYCNELIEHNQSSFFYTRVTGVQPVGVGDACYLERYHMRHQVNGGLPTKHSNDVAQRYEKLRPGQKDVVSRSSRLDPNKYCPTLRAGTGPDKGSFQAVRPIHYNQTRVITAREAARLQGFPDWFKLPDTIWHGFRQIGNSVSPIVAERILSAIFQKLTLK